MGRNRRILAALLLAFVCGTLCGQSLSQQKEKRSRLEKDISILRKQMSTNASQSEQALSSISLIQAQQKTRSKLLKETDNLISSYDRQISQIQADVNSKQAILDTLEAHYSRLVMGAYKNRDIKLWFMYILASENVSQAFRRFGYFKNLSSQISAQAKRVEAAQLELNAKKAELLSAKQEARQVRNERARELSQLKADEAQQKKIVDKLKKDNKAYQAALRSKQAEVKALDKVIAKMIADATKESKGTAKKPAKPVDYTLDKKFENNKGKLPWPVDGPVTEHFGKYRNNELKITLNNNGINIACEADSPVRCVFDGVVSNVMLAPGYGQSILVQHGTFYTIYCKVKNATVRQGDKVSTGQILGEVATIMGKTQLNFLVFQGQYLNPELWLRER